MSDQFLIAGMGRAADAVFVGFILVMVAAVSVMWLVSMVVRKGARRRERWAFLALWVLAIGAATLAWVGGRIADDRRHQQDMDDYGETSASPDYSAGFSTRPTNRISPVVVLRIANRNG